MLVGGRRVLHRACRHCKDSTPIKQHTCHARATRSRHRAAQAHGSALMGARGHARVREARRRPGQKASCAPGAQHAARGTFTGHPTPLRSPEPPLGAHCGTVSCQQRAQRRPRRQLCRPNLPLEASRAPRAASIAPMALRPSLQVGLCMPVPPARRPRRPLRGDRAAARPNQTRGKRPKVVGAFSAPPSRPSLARPRLVPCQWRAVSRTLAPTRCDPAQGNNAGRAQLLAWRAPFFHLPQIRLRAVAGVRRRGAAAGRSWRTETAAPRPPPRAVRGRCAPLRARAVAKEAIWAFFLSLARARSPSSLVPGTRARVCAPPAHIHGGSNGRGRPFMLCSLKGAASRRGGRPLEACKGARGAAQMASLARWAQVRRLPPRARARLPADESGRAIGGTRRRRRRRRLVRVEGDALPAALLEPEGEARRAGSSTAGEGVQVRGHTAVPVTLGAPDGRERAPTWGGGRKKRKVPREGRGGAKISCSLPRAPDVLGSLAHISGLPSGR